MSGGQDMSLLAQQLAAAVELTMSPAIPMEQRSQAFTRLEDFKETSPYVSQCGFYLVNTSQTTPVVRHFGLKLLEDVVKARWNSMVAEEKIFIKENLMKLMSSGTGNLMTEHLFIKDALARVVVELVKREWPQQWPSLLTELDSLCREGETQTELVMFVLLRLVEDVALLQTLEQNQRRKEIYSALTSNMEQLFSFLLGLLEKHYRAYKESESGEHCRVAMAILNTFTSLVEWVNIQHCMANEKYLLRCLTHLLSDPRLQQSAGDCLLGVVSWRAGKMTERAQLLCLFETDLMAALFAATENAEKHSLDCDHYTFLKKMVEILTMLGDQLCALWTKDTPRAPPNLGIYLDALLSFTRHQSQMVNHLANELWSKFFRHPDISLDPVFMSYQPKWAEVAMKKSVKVGYPEREDHPSCQYSQLDWDNDEEFYNFFIKYKLCIMETVRCLAVTTPLLPLTLLDQWLRSILPSSDLTHKLLELEAISSLLESTFSKLVSVEQVQPVSHLAVPLLELLLSHSSDSPLISSELLSCISALFSCVLVAPSALNPLLIRVFTPLNNSSNNQIKDVRTLRRHCCSLLVKLATKFPKVLLPTFSFLQQEIQRLNSAGLLTKMENVTLTEALVIVSNQLENYEKQSQFLTHRLVPITAQLKQLENVFSSPTSLMTFVGLTQPPAPTTNTSHPGLRLEPVDQPVTDQAGQQRSELCMLMNSLLAVTRRAAPPSDQETAARGGFCVQGVGGSVIVRNPAGRQACLALPQVFLLAQTMNKLLDPALKAKLHPGFAKAFDMLEVDRNNILGLPGSRTAKNEVTYQLEKLPEAVSRMQNFVTEMFENMQHLMSHYSTNISHEFYHQPGLANSLCLSVLANLPTLPDFRLRAINKMFLKSFINKCPTSCFSSVILPVLGQVLPFMLGHLGERWAYLAKIRESPGFDEDNTDSQEVLDDVIIRLTAREYMDTLKAVLTSGGGSDLVVPSENSQDKVDCAATLSPLGDLVLSSPSLSQPLTLTILAGISWPDSPSSCRAASLLELVLPRLLDLGQVQAEDAAGLMMTVLKAFQENGKHEANNIALTHLALTCYEKLRVRFVNVRGVLAQVPNCQVEDLEKFDNKILQSLNPSVKGGEKAKKDMFKKMIASLIGKETAKLFQKEIVIKNLPNMATKVKAKTPSLDEQTDINGTDTGLTSLFA